ncbi:MAG: methionine aminotransferase [Bacteroidota bacterium]|nr:methionine aminotransferase [Bacteroidota bacterium]MDP4214132.1 methionine aminotransferase [Bacteroidota bacterium]MDP4251880.1 methionine aminotransferase [Bacteroidota bacterium]
MQFASKLPDTGTTIFTTMSALAAKTRAINLGQGFPDFPMDESLIEKVTQAMEEGFNQYAPMEGYLRLRETLAEKIEDLYQHAVRPDTEITVTPGGTYAIYTALTTLLQPGDEVIVFEPAYDSYIPGILMNGAVPVTIPLEYPSYRIDWDKVRAAVTDKTKLIMLNSPHNPTGAVLGHKDIEELRRLVHDSNIFIHSDEVYEHIILDGLPHLSILRYPDLWERSFVSFSLGKIFHCTGWKMGYSVAPEWLMKEFRKLHQYNAFSTHSPVQVAMASFLKEKTHYMSLPDFMQEKRDYFQQLMSETRFRPLQTHGSYFQIYSYKEISDEPDFEFAKQLVARHGVTAIPVSAFYQNGKDDKVLRFCFAKKKETLELAVEKLRKA